MRQVRSGLRLAAALVALVAVPRATLAAEADRDAPARHLSVAVAGALWGAAQLLPSPLLVIGKDHVGAGVRWQVTPLSYSFGITERPLRPFLVSPIARHSGSVELHASPEWACCPVSGNGWLVRSGLRLYLPLLEHGERLSWSLGGSYYRSTHDEGGVAIDAGLYTLLGVLGWTVTFSPALSRRELIAALNIRYF